MGIQTNCPTCDRAYNLRDNQAGLQVRCRNCDQQFTVPGEREAPVTARSSTTAPSENKGGGGWSIWLWVGGGVGGFFMLVCLGVCGGLYYFGSKAAEFVGDPKDLSAAVQRLNSGDRVKDTAQWLQRQNVDKERQPEVARALAAQSNSKEIFSKDDVFKALEKWATPEQVPLLMETAQKEAFGVKESALDTLLRLRDPRSAVVLLTLQNEGNRKKRVEEALSAMTAEHPKETTDILLAAIKDGGDPGRAVAEYLGRQTVDPTRQEVIATTLAVCLEDGNHKDMREPLLRALSVWATANQVPLLVEVVRSEHFGARDSALEALIRLHDPRSADILNANVRDPKWKTKIEGALKAMGGAGARETLNSQLARLNEGNPEVRSALDWFAQQPVDPTRQAEVAKALAALAPSRQAPLRELALKALVLWATSEQVPVLMEQAKGNERSTSHEYALDALLRLKDVRSIPVLLENLNPERQQKIDTALRAIGPAGMDPLLKAMNDPAMGVRKEARTLLTEVCHAMPDALLTQVLADLSVATRLVPACEWLVSQATLAEKSPRKGEVARALETRIKDTDKRNLEACYDALAVWSDNDSIPVLLKGLEAGGKPFKNIADALARTQDPKAAAGLAARLGQGRVEDRKVLVDCLKKMPPAIVEPPLLEPLQGNPGKNLVLDACDVLADTGTSKAASVLEAVGKKNKDAQVQQAIRTALEAIRKRT